MKNTLLKSLVCCALLFIGFSCGGGGELSTTPLAISTSFIETDVLGSTTTITVDAPRDWYAATTGEKWIRLTPSSGKAGKTEMKVTIKPNDSGKSRTAQITFNAGQDKEIIDVQQEWGYYFTLPCTEYTIGYGGGEIIVNGLPKSGFAITTSVAAQSWIKVIGNKLKVSFNDGKTSRNAVLNIKDNSAGKTYEVLLFQESSSGADNILALKEFTIDGYNCPSDSFTPASDFFYSVDMDATTTSKTAKVTFSGEGVEWITIGDNTKKIKSGDTVTFEDMTANTKIKILTHNSLTDKVGQNFLIISGLPLVVINSQGIIVDEPKVDCTFSIFDPKARTDAEEKNLVYFESLAGIEFRGAGAQRYPKKPYNFKLRDSNGNKREAEILNIRNDNSWILDAMYLDMARMRNRVCFDLWNTFNKPYYVDEKPKALSGTRGHYVEVFVNGEYMGLFILSDRIDRKQYQLEQNGGYIYKSKGWTQANFLQSYSKPSNDDFFWNSAEIEQEYPDADDGGKPNFNHMASFIDFVSKTSKAEFSAKFADRIAENSVIDTFIFLNLIWAYDNAGRNTFWIFRNVNESPKVMHGLWDLDGTLGRDWNRVKVPASNGWYYGNNNNPSGTNYFKLFKRIIDGDVEGLQQKIYDRWVELKDKQLAPAEFNKLVDYYAEQQIASGARDREVARWRALESQDAATGTNGWVHYTGNYGNVEEEVAYMKQWYRDRVAKVDKLLSKFNSK